MRRGRGLLLAAAVLVASAPVSALRLRGDGQDVISLALAALSLMIALLSRFTTIKAMAISAHFQMRRRMAGSGDTDASRSPVSVQASDRQAAGNGSVPGR